MNFGNRQKNNRFKKVIVTKKDITIQAEDGFPLAATLFVPQDDTITQVVVIGSALGVPRYIYFKLARFFAQNGCTALTFDYRGIHQSQNENVSGSSIKMADWGALDIDAVLAWANNEWQPQKITYFGHSCGGQVLGLAQNAHNIDKAIFVASQSGYWKLWEFPYRWGVCFIWYSLPLLTPWFDKFPARALGISSVNIPSGVARQWAEWGRSTNYLWDNINQEALDRYNKLSFPLLSVGFTDDHFFGPPESVQKLLNYYPQTESKVQIIAPSEINKKKVGHFGFLKDDFAHPLWNNWAQWLLT
ncbi:alpha/beta hydrolase family protein [Fodinibius saliphilus]|uniref:alpha/beta hydrolase family protein n=1 Tax=Fodinibius saliphilus TaxID=1920650 RepID=UPI001486A099|nr:alpha/beta fold hydrolase [Fodinibius saliphilus]